MTPQELVTEFALSFLGNEYIYGGNGPFVDCSGLCIQLLKASGVGPPHDMTAQQLFEYYKPLSEWNARRWGALCFYGRSINSIDHIAFALNESQIIEAGGGTSRVTTKEIAQQVGAFVRVRMINYRPDFVVSLGVKYPFTCSG